MNFFTRRATWWQPEAVQTAVESWFSHGNGDALLFDEVILPASDERYDTFDFPQPGRLSDLYRLGSRISIYLSRADSVLVLGAAINLGAKRLVRTDRITASTPHSSRRRSTAWSTAPASGTTLSISPAHTSITGARRGCAPTLPRS
jgi:hypothetical protein